MYAHAGPSGIAACPRLAYKAAIDRRQGGRQPADIADDGVAVLAEYDRHIGFRLAIHRHPEDADARAARFTDGAAAVLERNDPRSGRRRWACRRLGQ